MSADLPDGPQMQFTCRNCDSFWSSPVNWDTLWSAHCPHCGKDCYIPREPAPASPAKEVCLDQSCPVGVTHYERETPKCSAKEAAREGETQYARRDIEDLCEYYTRHLDAMTREGLHSKSDIAAELGWRDRIIEAAERRAADAEAKVEYARRVGLHVAIGTSTDCPEGRLQHDFTKGTELGRVFDEWSDSIGHEARLKKTKDALTAAEFERDALRDALAELRSRFDWHITHYNKNGPEWTSEASGMEYFSADTHIDLLGDFYTFADAALAPSSETTTAES